MAMEGFAGAFLGGIVAYAIGKDGKILVPVTQEQVNRLLRDAKPEFLKKVDIDTSIARDGSEESGRYDIAGSFILVFNPGTPTDTVYIKLNEPTWPEIPLTSLRRIVGPFYRFFIKNAAGSGTLNLVIAKGYQFQMIEKEEAATVSLKLDNLEDVAVTSPGDLYILYFNNATQNWECRPFTDWLHASAHENGGADEVSVAGLSGLLADDQHVLDAEVLAVAAALVHASRHQNGGADEISVAGLSGELADDQPPKAHDASKVTSGRFPMARMPDMVLDKIMVGQGAGNSPVEEDKYTDAKVQAIIAAKLKAGTITDTTGADGKISVTFAEAFASTPIVTVQLENDVDYYPVMISKSTTGFTVKILKTAHIHSQENTGAEASHTHGVSLTSGAGSSHTHSNPNTSAVSAGTPAGYISLESAGTPAGSIGGEASHTHSQGVTGGPSATNAGVASGFYTESIFVASTSGGSPTTELSNVPYLTQAYSFPSQTHTHTNPTTGAGSSHTHGFYGSAMGDHNHTFTGSALGTHYHTQGDTGSESSHTHSVSGTSGAGSNHSHTNPNTDSANAGNTLASTEVTFSYIAIVP